MTQTRNSVHSYWTVAQTRNTACNYWTDGNYCGDANTRRYMIGWRCIKHTPAAIRGWAP
jgi:hypothetical protein